MQMVGFSREWIIPHRVYLYVHHISFINSPFDGHLGCLQPHGLNSPWDFPYLSYHEQCWSEHGTIGTSLISCFHFFFFFFWPLPRSRIVVSCGNFIFNFLRKWPGFPISFTNSHSYQQCNRGPFLSTVINTCSLRW